jgi:hypothetical protein
MAIRRRLAVAQRCFGGAALSNPADLDARVRAYLAAHPEQPWDAAVRVIAGLKDDDENAHEN